MLATGQTKAVGYKVVYEQRQTKSKPEVPTSGRQVPAEEEIKILLNASKTSTGNTYIQVFLYFELALWINTCIIKIRS